MYVATRTDNIVVTFLHACKITVISSAQPAIAITYSLCQTALLSPFVAFSDSVSVAYSQPTLCGLVYSFTVPTDATPFGVTISGLNISTYLTDVAKIGLTVNLLLQATATPVQTAASPIIPVSVTIAHPCPASTITLPNAISSTTIVSMSGISSTVTFSPATNSAETTLVSSGYCGPRTYSLVGSPGFVTIVSPAPANEFTSAWSLVCLSTNLADVGIQTVILQATLQNYPSVPAVTKSFTVTINHICSTTSINSQTLTVSPYQISKFVTSATVLTFMMNTDSIGVTNNNLLFCGKKKFTTNKTWLSVTVPTDPVNNPCELVVSTNLPTDANTYSVTLTVGFEVGLTQTITETFSITLLHPCVATLIYSSQVLS